MAKKPTAIAMNTTSRTVKLPLVGNGKLIRDGDGCAPLLAGNTNVGVGEKGDLAEVCPVGFYVDHDTLVG